MRRVREAFLGQFARADGGDQGVAQPAHGLVVGEAAAHADGVRAGGDREDAAALDAVGGGDGLHLHAVGDDQAVVAELVAQERR